MKDDGIIDYWNGTRKITHHDIGEFEKQIILNTRYPCPEKEHFYFDIRTLTTEIIKIKDEKTKGTLLKILCDMTEQFDDILL